MSRLNTLVFAALSVALTGVRLAPAQTTIKQLSVYSGNGQAACICLSATLQSFQPISVKATDQNGVPVSGATVTWTVTSGELLVSNPTSVTNAAGIASMGIVLNGIYSYLTSDANPYLVATVSASTNNLSVTFTETESLITNQGDSVIEANPPTFGSTSLNDATLSANAGSTLSTPIQTLVAGIDLASNGVQNISVRILNEQSSPVLSCTGPNGQALGGYADPGSVLSSVNGSTSCYPKFSGSGTGTYYILIGGLPATDISTAQYLQAFGPFTFNSIPGAPASVQIISGNNQVAPVGQQLNPLVAQLIDANGNPVQGKTMMWSVIPAGAVALAISNPVTDNNGEVSTTVSLDSLASSGAAITVALQSTPSISATFQETVSGAITALKYISGSPQTAQVGTDFALPLVVQVLNSSGPVANYPVQFVPTSGVSLPGGTTVNTNSNGQASVTVLAGSLTGTATVTAVAGPYQQTFALTLISQPTAPPPNGISIVIGNSQSVIEGASFGEPLTVLVNSTAGAVPGYTVNYSSTGPVSLSAVAATTNGSGQASINVTAGFASGPATVTATANGYSVTFNLNISPPGPQISASSFLNAASRQVGALSPCSLAIISAAGLTPDPGIADLTTGPIFGRLPKTVNGLSVTFGGIAAPIMRVAMGATFPEVTIQVPCEVPPASSVPVVVNVNGGGTATTNIPIYTVSPGIFQQVMSDGTSRAVALRSDGTFADVGGTDSNDPNNPVRQGEDVRFYLTGLGATNPFLGNLATSSQSDTIEDPDSYIYGVQALVTGIIQVGFPGSAASVTVVKAHAAPGLIGVYEVEVTIPNNAPLGNNVPLSIGIVPAGSSSSTPGTFGPQSTVPIGQ